jgi:large subunit ribosomal protein L21
LNVELLENEPESQVELTRVLLASDGKKTVVGTPAIKGAKVTATVESHGKGPKITVFRYKSKVRHSSKIGHRQPFTRLTVNSIEVPELTRKARKKSEEKKEENQDGA